MTKKILFIMHLDWKYVKQRPHFIAEELSDFYDVNVVYFYSKRYLFGNYGNKTPNDKKISITPAFRLPFYENDFIYKINTLYMRFYFKFLIRKYKPDFIWITFPMMYDYISQKNDCKLIYDCMDNISLENFDEKFLNRLLNSEVELLGKAELIFSPTKTLSVKLNERLKCQSKLFVINNAFDGKIITDLYKKKKKDIYKIGYVGTISSWFDFELLESSLTKFDNIEYHIIGPVNKISLNSSKRIKFYGAIEHGELYNYVKNFDAMIMPYKLNDIINVADPVKFYDYINFNKPIISIFFEEIKRYDHFVTFYSNKKQFFEVLEELIDKEFNKKYSDEDRIQFLKNNSWNDRVKEIIELMESLNNK